jgi:hypothetical protein
MCIQLSWEAAILSLFWEGIMSGIQRVTKHNMVSSSRIKACISQQLTYAGVQKVLLKRLLDLYGNIVARLSFELFSLSPFITKYAAGSWCLDPVSHGDSVREYGAVSVWSINHKLVSLKRTLCKSMTHSGHGVFIKGPIIKHALFHADLLIPQRVSVY